MAAWFGLTLAAGLGCGPPKTPGSESETETFERSSSAPDPTGAFVQESYGIGASWYAYDGSTHALTPHPEWYRLELREGTYALHVDSYYGDKGESGFFTLKVRTKSSGGWSAPETFKSGTSVKKEPVCVDLDTVSAVPCDSESWHLILRTDLRAVPAAGFAVSNPALYVRGHYSSDSENTPTIEAVEGDRPSASKLEQEGVELPSSRLDLADSALGPLARRNGERRLRGSVLQATADMRLAEWSVEEVEGTGDQPFVRLRSSCRRLASDRGSQSLPSVEKGSAKRIALPSDGTYGLKLVELCDDAPSVVQTNREPLQGRWRSTEEFDLIVERWRDSIAIRLPPGHLVWKPGESLDDQAEVSSVEQLPGNLWGEE